MYITFYNIKGEKRIDLSYSILNFDSCKEIAVIRMLSENVQYKILKLRAVMDHYTHLPQRIINKNIRKSCRKSIMGQGANDHSLFIKIFAR